MLKVRVDLFPKRTTAKELRLNGKFSFSHAVSNVYITGQIGIGDIQAVTHSMRNLYLYLWRMLMKRNYEDRSHKPKSLFSNKSCTNKPYLITVMCVVTKWRLPWSGSCLIIPHCR
eukprot:XP_001708160.1 Hypothetical protein GL50803_20487 [Giardia lamblia ATCC 50803]